MTIADWISDLWPETEAYLRGKVDYDTARDNAITSAATELYATVAPGVDVPPLDSAHLLIQQQIADLAVQRLIPLAKTTIAQHEALQLSDTYPGGAGGSTTGYNQLQLLDDLADDLKDRTTERSALVTKVIRAAAPPPPTRTLPTFFTLARGERGR